MNAPEGADTAAPPFLDPEVCGKGPRWPQKVLKRRGKRAQDGPRRARKGPENGPDGHRKVSKTADETEKEYGERQGGGDT